MPKVKIELNHDGIRELLRSSELGAALQDLVSGTAARCGDGYDWDVKLMGTRVIASVYTAESEAIQDNLDNNTILRSLQQ